MRATEGPSLLRFPKQVGGADGGSGGPRGCSVGTSILARVPAPAQPPRLGWTPGPSSPIPLVAAGATHLPVLRPHVVPQGCPSALLTFRPQPPTSRPPRLGAPSTAFSPQSPGSPSARAPAGSGAGLAQFGGLPSLPGPLTGGVVPTHPLDEGLGADRGSSTGRRAAAGVGPHAHSLPWG